MERAIYRKYIGYWLLIIGFVIISAVPAFCQIDTEWRSLISGHDRYAEIDGFKLHFIDIGKGDPVLMIHGFSDSSYGWRNNAKELIDAGLRLIIVDLPGLGSSEALPKNYSYTLGNISSILIKLLNQLKLDRVSLVGGSMGGGVCLYIAKIAPKRVKRVVVIDPACDQLPTFGPQLLFDFIGPGITKPFLSQRWVIRYALKDMYYAFDKVDETLVYEYARRLDRPDAADTLHRMYTDYFTLDLDRLIEAYPKIHTPILILWGDHDGLIPVRYGRDLHKRLPNSRLKIIGWAGHIPHQERPEAVNPLLVSFLGGIVKVDKGGRMNESRHFVPSRTNCRVPRILRRSL